MTEHNDPTPEAPKRTALAKCERHGLHYDPAKMSGCVICRREAQAAGSGSTGDAPAATVAARRSLAGPLLATAALCFGAGLAFYLLHGAVANLLPGSGGDSEIPDLLAPQRKRLEQAARDLARGDAGMTSGIEGGLPTREANP
ncbi:MAG TPA: hypothetical protein VGS22_21295 [Thermoanaerobaculia bacterium]|jgi:hypothetical protein|nr:hypothetical protein [Thermoanaerobaculia bacterium]